MDSYPMPQQSSEVNADHLGALDIADLERRYIAEAAAVTLIMPVITENTGRYAVGEAVALPIYEEVRSGQSTRPDSLVQIPQIPPQRQPQSVRDQNALVEDFVASTAREDRLKHQNELLLSRLAAAEKSEAEAKEREAKKHYRATHDKKTGVLNDDGLDEYLETNPVPGALLLLDLCSFKATNDLLGHVAGDRALKRISRVIQKSVPEGSVLARIGGDEFIIVLPQTNDMDAQAAAEYSRKVNEELDVAVDAFMESPEPEVRLLNMVGFGVAVGRAIHTEGQDYEDIKEAADVAMTNHKLILHEQKLGKYNRDTYTITKPGIDGQEGVTYTLADIKAVAKELGVKVDQVDPAKKAAKTPARRASDK